MSGDSKVPAFGFEPGETVACCEWCGEDKKPEQMATEFLCDECIHVADLDGDPS